MPRPKPAPVSAAEKNRRAAAARFTCRAALRAAQRTLGKESPTAALYAEKAADLDAAAARLTLPAN